MATLSELGQSAQALDPYAEFRKGQMTGQKFDIQQSVLDEQTKEIEAEKAASLEQQAGQPGQPAQLAKMANEMIPGAKLYNDDGSLTTAGQINETMVSAAKLAKQSKMMQREAVLIDNPFQRIQATSEARRLSKTAQDDLTKAREMNNKVKNDAIYAAVTGEGQEAWDAAIKSYQDSGLPLPQGIPTTYSPENAKKLMALLPADLQSRANTDLIKRSNDRRLLRIEENKLLKDAAKERDGEEIKGLPKTKDEREGYIARTQTIDTIKDIQSLLDDPKYAKIINPSTKFTPQIIANLQENFPEISQKLARIQAYEFSIGGKALTKQEQTILEPIYGWRGLTAEALKKRLSGVESEFTKRNKMDEAVYPGLKKLSSKFAEIESESKAAKPNAISSAEGNAPQAALDYLKANPTQKDAFKKKYGYLPKGY